MSSLMVVPQSWQYSLIVFLGIDVQSEIQEAEPCAAGEGLSALPALRVLLKIGPYPGASSGFTRRFGLAV